MLPFTLVGLVLAATMLPARTALTVFRLAWIAAGGVLIMRSAVRWRAARAVREPEASTPRPAGVAGRYGSLYAYLEHRFASSVVLTFEEMESLLGFALPIASRERDWWTSAPHADRHSEAWTVAGRSATPNLSARSVAFARVS